MSNYLLALALGPVQDFIAAARRTRDLWLGSHLLSEISKAAARVVAQEGGQLVFPAPERSAQELADDSELTVANVILAEVPEGTAGKPGEIADRAKAAAQGRWEAFAKQARREVHRVRRDGTSRGCLAEPVGGRDRILCRLDSAWLFRRVPVTRGAV